MYGIKLSLAVCLLLPVSAMQANSIFTINNTGAGSTVTSTSTVAVIDNNWTINGGTAYVTDNSGFPFGVWLADNLPVYAWISPQQSYTGGQTDTPNAIFDFRTTFDLTGFDPTTADLQFVFAVDNELVSVSLNGNTTSIGSGSLGSLSSTVDLNSGFVAGINTLDFQVLNTAGNANNPTGLLVEFTSATADAPEPATAALLGAGLLCVSLWRRKH